MARVEKLSLQPSMALGKDGLLLLPAPQEHHCGQFLCLRLAWRALICALQLHSPQASGTEGKGLQEGDVADHAQSCSFPSAQDTKV